MSSHDPSDPTATRQRPAGAAAASGPAADPQDQPPRPQASPGYAPPYPPPPGRIATQDPRTKSPVLACVLSALPGLGQVYVGYYQRGFVHALVAGACIALIDGGLPTSLEPMLAMFLSFFWLYNIIDAGRRAALYNQVLAGTETIDLPSDFKMPSFGGSIFGGLALIVIGVVLLLHTRWNISLEWLEDWWPVVPILLGVYLIVRAMRERSAAGGSAREEPPPV